MIGGQEIKKHLIDFQLRDPELIEHTALSDIFRVKRRDGTFAVLKCWHDPFVEQSGVDYLAGLNGQNAVRILDRREGAILMEELEGPSLGAMVRAGDDKAATKILADVARSLRETSDPQTPQLVPLKSWFHALFEVDYASDCDPKLRENIDACKMLARKLLDGYVETVALHGDLHHDNIMQNQGKWVAIDAKGLCGDPAFDLANALRNPIGFEERMRQPEVIKARIGIYAASLGISEQKMLSWAAVKTALSISWRGNGSISADPDSNLLDTFLKLIL